MGFLPDILGSHSTEIGVGVLSAGGTAVVIKKVEKSPSMQARLDSFKSRAAQQVGAAKGAVENKLHREPDAIDFKAVAAAMGISEEELMRQFQSLTENPA